MENKQSMIKVENLEVFYGGIQAIYGISLEIFQRETVAIIGASEAGKSIPLKTLASDKGYRLGTIAFQGQPLPSRSHQFVEKGISLVPEGRKIFVNLTVRDSLMVGAYTVGRRFVILERLGEVYSLFPRPKEREKQMGGALSGGEQQILAVGRAMMVSPKPMVLDEPSLRLAPIIIDEMLEKSIQINKKYGATIIIVEQNTQLALETAYRGYVLNAGKIQMEGEGQALLDDPRIQEAYLGFKQIKGTITI